MRLPFVSLILFAISSSAFGQTYMIQTFAGNGYSGYSGDNGPSTSARFYYAEGVAVDAAGVVYIADVDNCRIRKVSNGWITTVAGNGICGDGGDNGPALAASLCNPRAVAVGPDGSLYIADTFNNRIRRVADGVITTFAGSQTGMCGAPGGYGGDNGPATSAQLYWPFGIAVDAANNLYIADSYNERIRKVSGGVIATVAGNGSHGYGGDGFPATGAQLFVPDGVAVDAAGNLYIADTDNNVIRKVAGGTITTVAGNGTQGLAGDGGPATLAELYSPLGVAIDGAGNLYISDSGNNRVRKVVNGAIVTVAGAGPCYPSGGYNGDNIPATSADLNENVKIALDGAGNIYVADDLNFRIRVLTAYPVSLSSQAISSAASGGGSAVQVTVAAGIPWSAASNASWITIASGATGSGSGAVTFTLAANTGAARSGTIVIADQVFTVEQEGASTSGMTLAGSVAQIASAGGWDTALTLVNLGSASSEARLDFSSDDGSTPWLPFTLPQQPAQGTTLAQGFDRTLNSNASLVLDTTGPAAQASEGSARLHTNGDVNGFAIFTYVPTGQAAVAPLETRNASSYLLAFDNTGQVSTGVAIANLAGSAANIGVVIRNDAGAQIGAGSIELAAQGHNSFMLTDATYGFPATAGLRGTIEFDTPSGGQISVLGLRANAIPNSSGFAVTSLPTLAGVGAGGGTMPHFASGAGWQTTFTLVNTGAAAATASLNFYGDGGTAVTLPLSFPQTSTSSTAGSVTSSIPEGGSLIVEVQDPGGATATSGSALLTTAGNIGGFAVFRYNPTGQEAVSPLQTVNAPSYILPFDDTGSLDTGLAIANLAAQPASIGVIIRNDAGAELAIGGITLPALGHTSFMLTDPSSGGWLATKGIRGTVEFQTPSGGHIAPLGLRTATIPGGFTMTSIPVMER
jgi:sugar lactone lactonase YvrE